VTSISILETNVLHASDVIYWLDGSSAENSPDMQRISHALSVALTTKPADLQLHHKAGLTALWRKPSGNIIEGRATEAEKTFISGGAFPLAGTVMDPKGLYIPRTFNISAGASAVPVTGQGLVLYPTPLGTHFGKSGGIAATLRYSIDGSPLDGAVVPWALLTVTVTLPGVGTQTYRAQADHRGDIRMAFNRIPPLPEGVTGYAAQLSLEARLTADPQTPLDTATLVTMNLEDQSVAGQFGNTLGLTVKPGEVYLIRSANKDHLAIRPS
jgi:hypothetical protein